PDHRRLQVREKRAKSLPRQGLPHHGTLARINPVYLKHPLCQIQTYTLKLHVGLLSPVDCVNAHSLALDAVGWEESISLGYAAVKPVYCSSLSFVAIGRGSGLLHRFALNPVNPEKSC